MPKWDQLDKYQREHIFWDYSNQCLNFINRGRGKSKDNKSIWLIEKILMAIGGPQTKNKERKKCVGWGEGMGSQSFSLRRFLVNSQDAEGESIFNLWKRDMIVLHRFCHAAVTIRTTVVSLN